LFGLKNFKPKINKYLSNIFVVETSLELLFKRKFEKIVIKSLFITAAFFITILEIWKIMTQNIGMTILTLITFYIIFFVMVENEVKNVKK